MISAPPPSSGGDGALRDPQHPRGLSVGELGFHSAAGTHLLAEAMRRAYHDRNLNLGDPSFVTIDTATSSTRAMPPRFARDRPQSRDASASLPAPGIGRRGQEHDPFLDRRQGRQCGVADLHAQRLVRRACDRGGHRHPAQRRDGRFLGQARLAQHVRPRRRPQQCRRAGQAAAVVDDSDHRHQGRQAGRWSSARRAEAASPRR